MSCWWTVATTNACVAAGEAVDTEATTATISLQTGASLRSIFVHHHFSTSCFNLAKNWCCLIIAFQFDQAFLSGWQSLELIFRYKKSIFILDKCRHLQISLWKIKIHSTRPVHQGLRNQGTWVGKGSHFWHPTKRQGRKRLRPCFKRVGKVV